MFGEWEGFFTTVAGVSVAAFSVLFVALQVKSDRWTSSRSKTWAAMAALTELLVPLIASLISLMPAHPWPIAAWITGGFGLLVIWGTCWCTSATSRRTASTACKQSSASVCPPLFTGR